MQTITIYAQREAGETVEATYALPDGATLLPAMMEQARTLSLAHGRACIATDEARFLYSEGRYQGVALTNGDDTPLTTLA